MSDIDIIEARLEATFFYIQHERMQDIALLNPALQVEAVGFRTHRDAWLGVLITPWFINLVMLPQTHANWSQLTPATIVQENFPLGILDFLIARNDSLGLYKRCTLFSPVQEFADQATAHVAARTAIETLLTKPEPKKTGDNINRRAFLRGDFRRQET